jgi:hypothetical protein
MTIRRCFSVILLFLGLSLSWSAAAAPENLDQKFGFLSSLESIVNQLADFKENFAKLILSRTNPFLAQLIPAPEFIVYSDSVSPGLINVFYGGTFNLQSSERVWAGTASIKAQTTAGGFLSFRASGSPQSLSLYKTLEFAVYPLDANFEVGVGIESERGSSPLIYRSAVQGRWTVISIPLTDLGPLPNLSRLNFITPAAQNWYIDQIKFVGVATYREPPRDLISPTVAIVSPTAGKILAGEVIVSATSSDNVGVASVRFLLDGKPIGEATSSPYSIRWQTASSTDGIHVLTAIARDTSGNEALSTEVKVEVKNPEIDREKPTVSIISPPSGASLTGKIPIEVEARDNVRVSKVDIFARSAVTATATLLRTFTAPPYSYSWDASKFEGNYLIFAIAYDNAGNFTTSSLVTIKLNRDRIAPLSVIETAGLGKPLRGVVTIFATSSDNVAVEGVQFKLDGTNIGSEVTSPPYSFNWNTLDTANGFHSLTAVARDTAGNVAVSSPVSVEVANPSPFDDSRAPVVYITSPNPGSVILEDSLLISAYASSSNGIAGVRLKLNGTDFGAEDKSPPYEFKWDTTLSENGSYAITAEARDRRGLRNVSWPVQVTLRRPPVYKDIIPPSVSIQSPLNGAVLKGTTTITASAADNVAVKSVQFKIDGTNLGKEISTPPYSYLWDTKITANGKHILSAVAYDAAGNIKHSEQIFVNVNNPPLIPTTTKSDLTPPKVIIISPAGKTLPLFVSSTVILRASSSDNVGVASIQFKIDGTDFGSPTSSPSYEVKWDTRVSSNGLHILTAVAVDKAGNVGTSEPVTVRVSNVELPPDTEKPIVFLTLPREKSVLSDTAALLANASDNVGVSKVKFKIDGTDFGSAQTKPPFKIDWDTRVSSNGIHVITATAYDDAGNVAVSNPVSVIVNNQPPSLDRTPPTVKILSPKPNSFVSGTVTLEATSTDNVGVAGVVFRLDGTNFWTEITSPPYKLSWDTKLTTNGKHSISAVARDALYNTAVSEKVTVEVKN